MEENNIMNDSNNTNTLQQAIAQSIIAGEDGSTKMREQRSHQIVESLLAKPSKKPDFASVLLSHNQPGILKRAQAFLPDFILNTDKILSNPDMMRASQMDVKIQRSEDFNPATQEKEFQQQHQQQNNDDQMHQGDQPTVVNMDIGVGVFDVQEDEQSALKNQVAAAGGVDQVSQLPEGLGFHQSSTEPILRIFKNEKNKTPKQKHAACADHVGLEVNKSNESDSDSDSESSPDEDRFMEFDSSSDNDDEDKSMGNNADCDDEDQMIDAQSHTTKSSMAQQQLMGQMNQKLSQQHKQLHGRPLIQEMSSVEFPQTAGEEESKDSVQVGQKRKFRNR